MRIVREDVFGKLGTLRLVSLWPGQGGKGKDNGNDGDGTDESLEHFVTAAWALALAWSLASPLQRESARLQAMRCRSS